MSGEANIWNPRTLLEVSADTKAVEQRLTASGGQTLFFITDFAYSVGTGALEIHKNGLLLAKGVEWVEQASTTFSLVTPASSGDQIVASAHVAITGTVDVRDTDIFLANYQTIRDYAGSEVSVYAQGKSTRGDGGEGFFNFVSGAAPSTYVDDTYSIIIPTGGNGSAAWIRKVSPVTKNTVSAMVADSSLVLNQIVSLDSYTTTSSSGRLFGKVVAAGTGIADGGSYIDLPNTTPALQWKQNFLVGLVDVKSFGANYDGTDDAAQVNAALAYAKLSRKECFMPGGDITTSQIRVPNGIVLRGAGIGEYGIAGDTDNVTNLLQLAGTNDDHIIFITDLQAGFERIQNGGLRDFVMYGDSTATQGNGISFRKAGDRADDANHAIIAGTFFLNNLLIRRYKEDGIYLRRGVTGNTVFRDVGLYFNGGYGIHINTITQLHMLLDNCGGDGNTAGAAIKITTTVRDSGVTLITPWGEYRANSTYGATPTFNAAQPYTVELGDFGSTSNKGGVVNIIGGTSLASFGTEGGDAGVYINCTSNLLMPDVNIVGHRMVNETSPALTAGNNSLVYDALNNLRIPGDVHTTNYTRRTGTLSGLSGAGPIVFGNDGDYDNISTGSDVVQVKGPTPAFSFSETDAPADEGLWSWVVSGGDLSLRTVSDAGTPVIALTISRVGNAVGTYKFERPIQVSGTAALILGGTGTPEGVVTASIGSTFSRTDGGAGTSFYVKESGAGNTGWVGK